MKVFLKRTFQFSVLPLVIGLLLLIGYLYLDPFKVLFQYADYSGSMIAMNRDHISTQMYLRHRERYHYNAFIFGSSRTKAFRTASWKKYLPADARPFMFDAWGETIYGIYKKVHFLDSTHAPLKYALVVLCRNTNFEHDENFYQCGLVKDPVISGECALKYHLIFFEKCFDRVFLKTYLETRMGVYRPEMVVIYDTVTNDQIFPEQEHNLATNQNKYYSDRQAVFYKRTGEHLDSTIRINDQNRFMLKEIARIFQKNHTEYKIVLSPLYEQIKFHPQDMTFLRSVFGSHLYDFTGANYFTNDIHHYYEQSHYRPSVGDSIMNIIYSSGSPLRRTLDAIGTP